MRAKIKILLLVISFSTLSASDDPFSWEWRLLTPTVSPGGEIGVEVTFEVPPGFYLYKEKAVLELKEGEGWAISSRESSPSVRIQDPFFGKTMDVYQGGAVIRARLKAPSQLDEGRANLLLELTYQGCSQELCYREVRQTIPVEVAVSAGEGGGRRSFLSRLILAFVGGMLTDFTPCVLPIIPITLAFIGVRRGDRTGRNLFLSTVLILSMATTYALMGLSAALLGKSLGFLFQGTGFLIGSAALYLIFAIALLGWIPFEIPMDLRNRMARWGGSGLLGAASAGATVGFLAAPCVGPILASLLVYVIQERDFGHGFLLLFTFGLGMGSLFLVIAAFYHSLSGRIQGGALGLWMKRILAFALLVVAGYYAVVAAGQIRADWVKAKATVGNFWLTDPREAFRLAKEGDKPLFVDFSASWCLPCLEMDRRTFKKPEVRDFLMKEFIPIRVDCTVETPSCKEMVKRFHVIGWPTYLVVGPGGQVRETVVGKVLGPEELIDLLKKRTTTPLTTNPKTP